ncbi:hypothetical protein L1887_34742 [Cichorium endivia]|nr:hypothetical protein L1887_34742 [Cichorium endivia]
MRLTLVALLRVAVETHGTPHITFLYFTVNRRTKLSPLEKFGNVLSYDSSLNSEAISATTSLIWVDGYASRYRAFGSH